MSDQEFELPEPDRDHLDDSGYEYELESGQGSLLLILKDFPFPAAYTPRQAGLMVILPAGYPNAGPDMFWTIPDVKLVSGAWPTASQHRETHGGREWQRWSRHTGGAWRPGIDNIRSYLAAIQKELSLGG